MYKPLDCSRMNAVLVPTSLQARYMYKPLDCSRMNARLVPISLQYIVEFLIEKRVVHTFETYIKCTKDITIDNSSQKP